MDYIKRQGRRKLRVSLPVFRGMDIFEEIEQPEVVYHMTDKENLNDILSDGKIKSFNDYVTFFFPDTKVIPIYIQLTGALTGKLYYGTDEVIRKAPPLDIDNTIVLELIPRRTEKLEWCREVISAQEHLSEDAKPLRSLFNQCIIAHYGNFQFRTDSVKVIKLRDIYDNMPQDVQNTVEWMRTYQKEDSPQ